MYVLYLINYVSSKLQDGSIYMWNYVSGVILDQYRFSEGPKVSVFLHTHVDTVAYI